MAIVIREKLFGNGKRTLAEKSLYLNFEEKHEAWDEKATYEDAGREVFVFVFVFVVRLEIKSNL